MKTTFFKQSLILIVFLFFFISCSKSFESINNEVEGRETIMNRELTHSDVIDFLDDYYKVAYLFGETENVSDGTEDYEITEVLLPNDTLPSGYVVTEKTTEKLLYFAHFDRTNEEIDAFDFIDEENFLLTDLGEDGYGNKIIETDLISYVKNLPAHSSERRFWGWSCGVEQCYGVGENEQCYRTCCYHIVWFTNGCGEFDSDNLPGSNPKIVDIN